MTLFKRYSHNETLIFFPLPISVDTNQKTEIVHRLQYRISFEGGGNVHFYVNDCLFHNNLSSIQHQK